MGKLSHGDEGFAGDLWGKSTLAGKEKGLVDKGYMGHMVRRKETLWGE